VVILAGGGYLGWNFYYVKSTGTIVYKKLAWEGTLDSWGYPVGYLLVLTIGFCMGWFFSFLIQRKRRQLAPAGDRPETSQAAGQEDINLHTGSPHSAITDETPWDFPLRVKSKRQVRFHEQPNVLDSKTVSPKRDSASRVQGTPDVEIQENKNPKIKSALRHGQEWVGPRPGISVLQQAAIGLFIKPDIS
jgi:hypothetical protein